MKVLLGILFFLGAFALANEPVCYVTKQHVYAVPNKICFDGSSWTNNPDGDMVVTVWGQGLDTFKIQMDEALNEPNYASVKVEGSFVNIQEDCGYNVNSELILSNIPRNGVLDLKNLQVSVFARSTPDNCHSTWKQTLLNYTRE